MKSRTPTDTEAAGEALAARLGAGDVVALTGDLGAGKTCFIRGLVRALGSADVVTSPTFVLVNHYRGRLAVYHMDAYRIDSLTAVLDLGFDEWINSDGVTVIEWADKLEPLLPRRTVRVHIDGVGDEVRTITVSAPEHVSDGGH